MKKARNSSDEIILLISPEPERLMEIFKSIEITNPEISVISTDSGIEGFELFKANRPCLTIVSDNIQDIPGVSVTTCLKESLYLEPDASIWLIDLHRIAYNMQADLFFPINWDELRFLETLKKFLAARTLNRVQYNDLNLSRESQMDNVPTSESNDYFDLNIIYSPFSQTGLSGDGLNYSFDEENKILSGYIFDVEGHDLIAYYNTGKVASQINAALRYNLKSALDFSMADVFNQVNFMACDLMDKDQKYTAAVIFKIDFRTRKMYYCSAGINYFLVKRKDNSEFEKIRMKNPLLGMDETSKYADYELDISGIDKLYISSDGFYSLLPMEGQEVKNKAVAKKDDLTLMMITLKEQKGDE